jgi:hypothetical protein
MTRMVDPGAAILTFAGSSMPERVLKLFRLLYQRLAPWKILLLMICFGGGVNLAMSDAHSLTINDLRDYHVVVEADIFSGRPNPSWELSDTLIEALLKTVKQLPETEAQSMFDGLGYRGFRVSFSNEDTQQMMTWSVQGDVVLIDLGGKVTYRQDVEQLIEKGLLDSGKPFLDEALFQKLENLIHKP